MLDIPRSHPPWLGAALLSLVFAGTAWAAGGKPATVTVSRSDCGRLVRHVPAPDVAYRPGLGVGGREVAPADLDGGVRIAPPERIVLDIEVDLQDRFGIPANQGLFEADARLGEVVVQDGQAYFNGQPLQDPSLAELRARCREILPERP